MSYPTQDNDRDLVLTRTLDVTPDKAYRCWTEPELLRQWFAPKPWTTPRAELDVRPGGGSLVVMADEAGTEYPNPGQYLDVEPGRKLVFTDAFVGDWTPSGKPFFTGVILFDPAGDGQTRYTAIARHWSAEDAAQHKSMGFHEGWGVATSQLEAVAKTL